MNQLGPWYPKNNIGMNGAKELGKTSECKPNKQTNTKETQKQQQTTTTTKTRTKNPQSPLWLKDEEKCSLEKQKTLDDNCSTPAKYYRVGFGVVG